MVGGDGGRGRAALQRFLLSPAGRQARALVGWASVLAWRYVLQ